MKRASQVKSRSKPVGELAPEYRFDYTKAKPNRFAAKAKQPSVAVLLDPDVAEVFTSGEAVNTVLRALLETMPAVAYEDDDRLGFQGDKLDGPWRRG